MIDRRRCGRALPAPSALATLTAVALSALFACTSGQPQVSTAFDPWARFPAQATYIWDQAAVREPDDPRIRELNFGPRLLKLTTEALAAHGYREVDSEPADYRDRKSVV